MYNYRKYDEQIDQLLSKMSMEQKIGQLNQIVYNGENCDELLPKIKEGKVGSLILAVSAQAGNDFQKHTNSDNIRLLQKAAIENTGIPLINGRDVIHGHKVVFPIPLAMAASFHPELIEKAYTTISEEAVNDGVDWAFTPMLDVSRDPRWGRCIEGPGEDPYLGSKMAEATIKGLQGDDHSKRESIAACMKHFIGYGAAEGGRDYASTEIGENSLRNYYLKAFQAGAEAGAATVMTSFNAISGQPVTSNKYLITDVLKKEFGFDGFTVSDWGAVELMKLWHGAAEDKKECAEKALNAGLDMDMVSNSFIDHVKELIEEGKVSVETLDEAVRRILRIKFDFGLFDNPYKEVKAIDYESHVEEAVKTAEECIVLLKNKDHILPLDKTMKIAAVGPMVNLKRDLLGSWTLDFDLQYVKSIREAFEEEYKETEVSFAETDMFDRMAMIGRNKDVTVVFLGESACVTGEAHSLSNIDIPPQQVELVKTLKNMGQKVVAVLCFGRPRAVQCIEPYCDAILYAWHGGTGCAQAIVHTLMGDNVPSGSLPMTILKNTNQIPLYYNSFRGGSNAYYNRANGKYEDSALTPMYPFGYGLSYTDFEYSEVHVEKLPSYEELMKGEKVIVSVEVKNTGTIDALETVQCYVFDVAATIARPLRELKGFQKLLIPAGEAVKVTFDLGVEELGYYGMDNHFRVDKGSFEIYLGRGAYCENKVTIKI